MRAPANDRRRLAIIEALCDEVVPSDEFEEFTPVAEDRFEAELPELVDDVRSIASLLQCAAEVLWNRKPSPEDIHQTHDMEMAWTCDVSATVHNHLALLLERTDTVFDNLRVTHATIVRCSLLRIVEEMS